MRLLVAILTIAALASGQTYNRMLPFIANYQKATVLNGSSQYWTKTSPSNVDLNGSELITASDDQGFESTVGNWTRAGTVSAAVRSTVDKRTGTASMRATSSGAGDTTSNYIQLNYPRFTTIVSGNKYTLELFARSATASRTITLRIGDAAVTSATLSTTFASFTKVVLNFQATASTINKPIYITTSGVIDSLYIDDVSLTQAYDALVAVWFNNTSTGVIQTVFSQRTDASTSYLALQIGTDNRIEFKAISSGGQTVAPTGGPTLADGKLHLFILTIDRTGTYNTYVDGVAVTSSSFSSIGKITALAFGIGALPFASPILYFNGQIGSFQFVRYAALPSDIVSIAQGIATKWKTAGLPKGYPSGTVTAHYDWRYPGTDLSGNANTLTPVQSPTSIKARF